MTGNNLYGTESLYEASFCLSKGHKLAGKEKQGDKYVVYLEGKDPHLAVMDYYNGGKVEARKLFDAYRSLKDYVFQR